MSAIVYKNVESDVRRCSTTLEWAVRRVTSAPATVAALWATVIHECVCIVRSATRRDGCGVSTGLGVTGRGRRQCGGRGRVHGKSALSVDRVNRVVVRWS
jgi:hypothetical protein